MEKKQQSSSSWFCCFGKKYSLKKRKGNAQDEIDTDNQGMNLYQICQIFADAFLFNEVRLFLLSGRMVFWYLCTDMILISL